MSAPPAQPSITGGEPSRLVEKLASRRMALGSMLYSPGAEWAELAGHVGLDYLMVDLMATSTDWSDLAAIVRAANQYGVTTLVRVPAFPWGSRTADSDVAAFTYRAFGVGAEGVVASVNTAAAVASMLEVADDARQRHHLPPSSVEGGRFVVDGRTKRSPGTERLVIPLLESARAIDALDEIVALDGLRAIFLGMGDLSRVLGFGRNDQSPEMAAILAAACHRAGQHRVAVLASQLSETETEIAMIAVRYRDMGVAGLLLPHAFKIANGFYRRTLEMIDQGLRA